MIPRIAKRGHSFKGAAQYYLHDKNAQTSERVEWTHTYNLPTDNAHKGFGWMAHTAMNADELKHKSGMVKTGRKRKAGTVYSFSLSWHPKQDPTKESMLEAAFDTLTRLKLHEQEAVIVAHNDERHPHLHVVVNLIHPETGRTAAPSHDRLTLSNWAENLERDDGEILCEQRVINNQKRRDQAKEDRELALIKHREEKAKQAQLIQELYARSINSIDFQKGLENLGYTLAKGDRRGFVLVDNDGKISSLLRQLKGQRTSDIKERLKDIEKLPDAKTISHQRRHFDRDQYETARQKNIVDAAIEEKGRQQSKSVDQEPKVTPIYDRKGKPSHQEYDNSHLHKLDALMAWEKKKAILQDRLSKQQKDQYKPQEIIDQIKDLKTNQAQQNIISKLFGKDNEYKEEINNLNKNLENIDMRIQEQNDALDNKIEREKPKSEEEIRRERVAQIRHRMQHPARADNLDREPGR
ncbi:relaxase/mobilization nuclease domain-containing protein [Croceimicrobium sp.]|uniref:relaxase/mobilization nuclease domain-containing protein n=1 Tax=Croceimicrobium sp. TaxID=2828340 RepID=UPI003BA8A8D5